MKLLKIFKIVLASLSALFCLIGIILSAYFGKMQNECRYYKSLSEITSEERRAWLDKLNYWEAVETRVASPLFNWFWALLLVFLIVFAIELLYKSKKLLHGQEGDQWPSLIMRSIATSWKKHKLRITVVKCILGILSVFGIFVWLWINSLNLKPFSLFDIVWNISTSLIFLFFCLIPLWILLILLKFERKINNLDQPTNQSE